jgi:hypothetical protein
MYKRWIETYENKKLNFCICFFGVMSRSLQHTAESIKKNILKPLEDNNINYDIYAHNMIVDNFTSERAGENNIKLTNNFHNLLPFNKIKETNQEEFDKTFDYGKYSKYGFTLGKENTFKNAIRQLYSLKMVNNLSNSQNKNYDLYIYVRPDLLYINEIDIQQIKDNISKDVLFTPHWYKSGGINDRIYFGKKKIIDIVANRLDYVEEFIEKEKKSYHPETHMKFMVDKFHIKTIDIDLKGKRVRSTGKIKDEDFSK